MPKSVSFQVNSAGCLCLVLLLLCLVRTVHITRLFQQVTLLTWVQKSERGGQKERVKVNLRQQHIHWRMRGFLDALYYHINSKGAFVRSIFAGTSAV